MRGWKKVAYIKFEWNIFKLAIHLRDAERENAEMAHKVDNYSYASALPLRLLP
jgi:hypothetical protein